MNEIQTMNTSNGSLPAVPESSNTIIQRIHAAKLELEKASNDSERKEIWKDAKQAEKVAAALDLTEIQVVAANLKIDCEVAITRANPPMSKAESGILGAESTNNRHGIPNPMPKVETSIPQTTIRDFRKAYDNLDDDEIEQAKQDAIDNQVPLTRSHFKEKSAEKKADDAEESFHEWLDDLSEERHTEAEDEVIEELNIHADVRDNFIESGQDVPDVDSDLYQGILHRFTSEPHVRERVLEHLEAMFEKETGITLSKKAVKPMTQAISPERNTMHTFGKQRNNTEEWYTPTDIIDKVHVVLGEIDLDPASNPIANEVVKAKRIYTKEDNGLEQGWNGKVFLNPPFGSEKISQFVDKLISEFQSGNVSEAILLTESLSQPKWFISAIRACDAVFMAADRFYYWDGNDETQRGWSKGYLFYFGSNRQAFYQAFKDIGTILTRYEVVAC